MKMGTGEIMPSDAVLTAYLDGELDPLARKEVEDAIAANPAVKERLKALEPGKGLLRDVFDQVLENAPQERLNAILSKSIELSDAGRARARPVRLGWGLAAIAASLLLLVGGGAGFMLGHSPAPNVSSVPGPDRWLQTVAEQVSLYDQNTFAHVVFSAADEQAQLARLGARVNLSLSPEVVALPGLSLKRVDILQVGARPLLQLVYQGEGSGPLALCIISETGEAGERVSRNVAGMNLVYWTTTTHGYLLVASASMEKLAGIAEVVDKHLPQ